MKEHEHKDCMRLLGSLSEFVDGELDQELCQEIESHMQDCENCRIVVDTLKKTVHLYHSQSDETVEIPKDVQERLFQKLNSVRSNEKE